jgi:hypothetical protein
MDRSNARYAYLINQKELVLSRWIGWRRLVIIPGIRHDVGIDAENGIWNIKLVLFYFHWIVANDESLWRWNAGFTAD